MGEEEKKKPVEEKKMEEKKPEEVKKPEEAKPAAEEKKEEKKEEKEETPAPPPPPPEIVLKVYMHCEGCARKVRKCLKGFDGVEDVMTDCKTHKVVVKGEKADPVKVLQRVQRKSHRKVELISPIPKPPAVEEKEKPKEEEKKEEVVQPPPVITVVLKVHMHCEACAQEIKKRIMRMKGVETAEPDLKSSEVTVKGVFDAAKLVEYVHKRTGKQAVIVKEEPEKKEEEKPKEEKKDGDGGGGGEKEKKDGGGEAAAEKEKKEAEGGGGDGKAAAEGAAVDGGEVEEMKVVELKRNEYNYYPPRYAMEMYAYPPQIFSDENPNACTVM